jgi:type VI secretion system protein ImpK
VPENDDPFATPDSTMLRPRPGGGRRGSTPGGSPPPRGAPTYVGDPEPLPPASPLHLGVGLNPLVRAASPLLLVAGQVRGSVTPMDVAGLRRYTVDEMRLFEERARAAGVKNEIVLAARYALCASLDEAVLSTPWGAQSEWAQHPMLVAFHREAWGGEKFFEMLDRISSDPASYIDLMELQYLNLALGFAGKYQMMDRGHEPLADVRQDLYRKIRAYRGQEDPALSIQWQGLEDRRNRLIRYVPWWVIGAAALAVLGITFAAYYALLGSRAAPIQAELAMIGLEEFAVPPPPPPVAPRGPTLRELLAPEEAAGRLTVEETGGRTVVTLIGADLFPSGSADVNPAYEATLQRIAEALNKVPGRVMVVGHTDDQPIKSLRYQDNVQLSRERAVSVASTIERTIDNRGRLRFSGVGSAQPRYKPESDPENRSRNRRVEIMHMRGS